MSTVRNALLGLGAMVAATLPSVSSAELLRTRMGSQVDLCVPTGSKTTPHMTVSIRPTVSALVLDHETQQPLGRACGFSVSAKWNVLAEEALIGDEKFDLLLGFVGRGTKIHTPVVIGCDSEGGVSVNTDGTDIKAGACEAAAQSRPNPSEPDFCPAPLGDPRKQLGI